MKTDTTSIEKTKLTLLRVADLALARAGAILEAPIDNVREESTKDQRVVYHDSDADAAALLAAAAKAVIAFGPIDPPDAT
jgi:hypothetical protein